MIHSTLKLVPRKLAVYGTVWELFGDPISWLVYGLDWADYGVQWGIYYVHYFIVWVLNTYLL